MPVSPCVHCVWLTPTLYSIGAAGVQRQRQSLSSGQTSGYYITLSWGLLLTRLDQCVLGASSVFSKSSRGSEAATHGTQSQSLSTMIIICHKTDKQGQTKFKLAVSQYEFSLLAIHDKKVVLVYYDFVWSISVFLIFICQYIYIIANLN